MAWDSVHLFECPTRVLYGAGASAQAGQQLAALGVGKALLVSDPGVAEAGLVERLASVIGAAGIGVAVYAKTEQNPTTTNLEEIAGLYRSEGCDGLVGLGGGSAMDAAKAASRLEHIFHSSVPEAPVHCVWTTPSCSSAVA